MADVVMPEDSELPAEVVAALRSLPPINIYRLLALAPGTLEPWVQLVTAIYAFELPPRLREIGICRQARSAQAGYELFQHRQIAGNNGVTQAEIDALLEEPVVTSLDHDANLVCLVADELEATATPDRRNPRAVVRDARAPAGDRAHRRVERVRSGGAIHERDACSDRSR